METLTELARRLDRSAETLPTAARAIGHTGPTPEAFGADGPGRLAEVGRALHEQWLSAAVARTREAEAFAARLAETAATLRAVAECYTNADDTARRRQPEQP
ncbi:hypothetical protein O7627_31645 [Solwaraspora sp. WMMD1047]|uniref:hypothetical protein n=1 Tax=Solwaraspora sp. WMMD1047 TaxID=3016102 RepID=UPI0024165FF8|nr:hypothetical protein [Solwaraspora sp. WMMD1047]MDG4833831.1 hypothetical protein [Solwaraspora sp. WMMD1047]